MRLLGLVAVALAVGSLSLGATVTGKFALYDPQGLVIYVVALFVAHAAQVLAGRRTDQVLLPTVALLGGISLLLMQRLPQDLVTQTFFGTEFGLAEVQLIWLLLALRWRRRSASSSDPTAGCAATSTRGRPWASVCCC